MIQMIIFTALIVVISFFADSKKTVKGITKGIKQFIKILPTLLSVIIIVSTTLYFVSNEFLSEYLGVKAGGFAYISAALIGSVSLLPGFIAFPLAGVLVKAGISYSVIAVFITSLMMVGFLTIPLEARYFGLKTAILRNALGFIGALIVGATLAIIFLYI